jgi:formylglycine-generating enzyme required for sulfatase activity
MIQLPRLSQPARALRWSFLGATLLAGWSPMASSLAAEAAAAPTNVLENSLGMRLARVPAAKVLFSIWETRVRDYQAFVAATGQAWSKADFEQTALDPAVNVTWDDAMAFCNWLTARERKAGRLTDRQRYRLPTDAEWSLAVGLAPESGRTPEDRLKGLIIWPWGYAWPPQPGDGNYAPELGVDRFPHTAPVGCFKPNRFGLYDLGGNVWEMCDDWYNEAHVTKAFRGGSFNDRQPKDLLAAYRFSGTVHLSNDDIGFRVVLETGE